MKKILAALLGLILLATFSGLSLAADEDIKGSKDHPLLTRMPGFRITSYKDSDFDSYPFIDADKKRVSVEGHTCVISYALAGGAAAPGELKIRRNVQDALTRIGGTVVFDDNFNRVSTIVLRKEDKEIWVEVRSHDNNYKLAIVEKEAMKQEVTADAAALRSGIAATGHVPVYGIYFDTGKAELKPESNAAIAEIARLLQSDAALKVYIVGHTDNVGSFETNMKLSKDRAQAVTQALIAAHGIAAERLKPHGVASLAPVASNDADEGRAKNRRVELVKQ